MIRLESRRDLEGVDVWRETGHSFDTWGACIHLRRGKVVRYGFGSSDAAWAWVRTETRRHE